MKGQGGGGTARGGGKTRSGGGATKIVKTSARKTKAIEAKVLTLRKALFDDNGKDKNVLSGIAEGFKKFDRNGLNVDIVFVPTLTDTQVDWAFDLARDHMEMIYNSSGYGWDDDDKVMELTEPGARFLLLKDRTKSGCEEELIGFAHFRFTVQGEVLDEMNGEPCLYLMDLHIVKSCQKKGLGKHIMVLLELIARQQGMSRVCVPVWLGHNECKAWVSEKLRGFQHDESFALIGFEAEAEVCFFLYCVFLLVRSL